MGECNVFIIIAGIILGSLMFCISLCTAAKRADEKAEKWHERHKVSSEGQS